MDYRAYILNQEGRISGYHQLDCADDEEAKQKAAQLLDGRDLEVWQRGRRVTTLKHTEKH